jgi:hypothetical protein
MSIPASSVNYSTCTATLRFTVASNVVRAALRVDEHAALDSGLASFCAVAVVIACVAGDGMAVTRQVACA